MPPIGYFGARYYSSQLGRFLTPDWSDSPEAVPYADLANPQSLNLYSYVLNNPVTSTDPDGHQDTAGHYPLPCKSVLCTSVNVFATSLPPQIPVEIQGLMHTMADFSRDLSAGAQNVSGAVKTAANWYMANIPCQAGQVCQSGMPEGEILEALDEILSGAIRDGGSSSKIFSKAGGIEQATEDFGTIPGTAGEKSGGVLVKEQPDGTKVILRNASSDGRPTVEIQHASGQVTKIRYGGGGQ